MPSPFPKGEDRARIMPSTRVCWRGHDSIFLETREDWGRAESRLCLDTFFGPDCPLLTSSAGRGRGTFLGGSGLLETYLKPVVVGAMGPTTRSSVQDHPRPASLAAST